MHIYTIMSIDYIRMLSICCMAPLTSYTTLMFQFVVDRHFTSVPLLFSMASIGCFFVGTCMSHGRSLLPTKLMKGSKEADSLRRGDSIWTSSTTGSVMKSLLQ